MRRKNAAQRRKPWVQVGNEPAPKGRKKSFVTASVFAGCAQLASPAFHDEFCFGLPLSFLWRDRALPSAITPQFSAPPPTHAARKRTLCPCMPVQWVAYFCLPIAGRIEVMKSRRNTITCRMRCAIGLFGPGPCFAGVSAGQQMWFCTLPNRRPARHKGESWQCPRLSARSTQSPISGS
jgi:hypothetical protein